MGVHRCAGSAPHDRGVRAPQRARRSRFAGPIARFGARLGPRLGSPPVHRPRRRASRRRLDTPGVKFSIRQILASTAGAVIAAIIASTFGVKGTIVGVAIGSAAATIGTALVAQSIERGHEAVKQVVVRAPGLVHVVAQARGRPVASGDAGLVGRRPSAAGAGAGRRRRPSRRWRPRRPPVGATERLEISAVADAPATERPARPRTGADAAGGPPGRPATVCAPVQLEDHRRHGGHRVRAGAPVHHGRRADLGQAAVGDLRRRRTPGPRVKNLVNAVTAGADAPTTDHVDARRRLDHVDDHVDVDRPRRRTTASTSDQHHRADRRARRPRRPRRLRRPPRRRPRR